MDKIGIIGAGNVSRAMLTGMAKTKYNLELIYVNSKSQESKEKLSLDLMVNCAKNNVTLVKKSKYIFFAIKSKDYNEVIEEVKDYVDVDNHIFISLAPGYEIKEFKEKFGYPNLKVVRAMPNLPSYVAAGMSCLSFSENDFSQNEIDEVVSIFEAFSEVEILEEDYIDTAVSISASSPAYVYVMIEAMGDAGVLTGMPRKQSYKLATQAIIGAAQMVKELDLHPGELKDAVCSPGGTTIEAIKVLENRGFRSALIESMLACYNKAKMLQK
ncbi:MAG: pyrroline-5-carboxylate reductase [Bacillota bacterium]|nr:pyrroline-5-carboxylate reductase [Bacillota bacterium]